MWRVHRVCTLQSRVNWATRAQSCCGLLPSCLPGLVKHCLHLTAIPPTAPTASSPASLCRVKQATGPVIRTGLGEGKGQKGRQKERRSKANLSWKGAALLCCDRGRRETGRVFWQYRQHLQHQLQVFHGLDFRKTWHWVTGKVSYNKCA